MPSFWKVVNQVLREADLIIEVLDARMINETRNQELEQKVKYSGKQILYVINKSDLVEIKKLEHVKKELQPCVFISSREKLGTTILKKKIFELAHGKKVIVGIVGYPNVGKSSLINALSGRKAARTSSSSGFTKSMQKIVVDQKIVLLDTPGVFSQEEQIEGGDAEDQTKQREKKHGLTASISFEKIKNPEIVVLKLIEEKKETIKKYYQVKGEDVEEILEEIALKRKRLRKGGLPDLESTARLIMKDWQTGKIREK